LNIEEYISSGILEEYVLGNLSEEESEQVSKTIAAYPELLKEVEAIEQALYNYAQSHSINPPQGLKEKLLTKVDEEEGGKQIQLPVRKKSVAYYLAAASIVVAIFSSSFSIYFWNKWKNAEQQILAMEQENATMAQNLNLVNEKLQIEVKTKEQYIGSLKTDLSIALDTSTNFIELKGLPLSPTASAMVLWNSNSHDVFIDVKNLPTPPADKQYQLWALHNGQPVDAGVFDVADSINLQKVKNIEAAQAFAVTLEKKGGVPSPTMDAMYLLGKL